MPTVDVVDLNNEKVARSSWPTSFRRRGERSAAYEAVTNTRRVARRDPQDQGAAARCWKRQEAVEAKARAAARGIGAVAHLAARRQPSTGRSRAITATDAAQDAAGRAALGAFAKLRTAS